MLVCYKVLGNTASDISAGSDAATVLQCYKALTLTITSIISILLN